MMHVSVEEIPRDLSASLQRGKAVKTLVIGRAGQPVAVCGAAPDCLQPLLLYRSDFRERGTRAAGGSSIGKEEQLATCRTSGAVVGRLPSARPRDSLCNGIEEFTVIIGTDSMLQFVHTQLPLRCGKGALARHPGG